VEVEQGDTVWLKVVDLRNVQTALFFLYIVCDLLPNYENRHLMNLFMTLKYGIR
jgi:hypothetical protein